jgi:hypothetical protein
MTRYLTRVELHDADGAAYSQLHKAMEAKGFSRTILGSDDEVYRLPTAEYLMETTQTRAQVYALAKAAAESTKLGYWIITVDYGNATFKLAKV